MKVTTNQEILDDIGGRELYILFGPYMKGHGKSRGQFWDNDMTPFGKRPWIKKYQQIVTATKEA